MYNDPSWTQDLGSFLGAESAGHSIKTFILI
jgi:hypothetical protein